jgi:DNA-directed RNA polymerase subunit M/transcription elongation factor TFIIS
MKDRRPCPTCGDILLLTTVGGRVVWACLKCWHEAAALVPDVVQSSFTNRSGKVTTERGASGMDWYYQGG